MIGSRVLTPLVAALIIAGPALTGPALAGTKKADVEAATKARASIPFADLHGRIRDWRNQGRDAILIEADNGQWYRADFMSPCHGLPFTETIGVVVDATATVDKFSSIVVRDGSGLTERCWFKSFKAIPDPDRKMK